MSVIATAVKHLLAAGVTGDALVDAIAEMEASMVVCAPDAAAERRRAYDRERKRAAKDARSGGIPVESAESAESLPLSRPPNDFNSNPPTHTPAKTNTTRVKGTRLVDSWQPAPLTGDAGEIALLRGPEWLKLELTKFRNHWIAKSGSAATKTDWQRTWANWIIQANEWRPGQTRSQSPPSPSSDLQGLLNVDKYKDLKPLTTPQAA